MKKKKFFFIVSAIILIILAFVIVNPFTKPIIKNESQSGNSSIISAQEQNEINFPVTAALVRRGDLIKWINTSGYAYPVKQYEIEPKLSGQVTELKAFDGKHVKLNDLLFKLDDIKYVLDLNQAKSDMVRAQIEYELQKANPSERNSGHINYVEKFDSVKKVYDHAKVLYMDHKISYDDFNRVERDYETLKTIATLNREDVVASRSGLTSAVTYYQKAKLILNYTQIKAPISGLVADCNIMEGSYVNEGQLCMQVIDISSIKIECEVTE
jgi:HlyD family secretion protein